MTDSPINPRADVSPTCRGSTGPWHNGWNPAPLVPPSRIVSQRVNLNHILGHDSCGVDIHGWNPDRSAQPTNSRTCGVPHALYRLIVPRPLACTCSSWPWWGLPDRSARRHRWSPDSLLSRPDAAVGRVRRGLRLRSRCGRKLGLLASSSPPAGGEGTSSPTPSGFGSSPYVRPCPEGRIASGGGSFAPASGFRPRGRPGLVLLGRRRCGSASSGSSAGSRSVGLSLSNPAEGGRSQIGGRSHCLCPVCSALLDHTRRHISMPISRAASRFPNVPFFSFGGSRP